MGRKFFTVLLVGLFLQALPDQAHAQTGRLAGTVTDASTGEPIPGVTVILDGTTQGAASDAEGRYVIIGITPDVYNVRFSFVGYTPKVIQNVQITSARTTTLDAQLSSEVVEGEELIVEAERPVVDQNQTTSRSLVSGEELSNLPVRSVEDAIARTSNAFNGFIRGSRRFEARTVIEGIDVSDSFYILSGGAGFQATQYGNFNRSEQQSASLLTLNPEGVSEVTVNSGATEAQYDAGSGGVVAVTLAEGRGPIRGSASFRISPQVNRPGPDSLAFYADADVYAAEAATVAAGDPDRAGLYTFTEDKYTVGGPEYDARFNLGGSITDQWTFSLSGQYFQSDGFQPNYFRQRLNGQLKSSFQLSTNTKVTAIGIVEDNGLWGGWNNRSYSELWRFYLEGVAQQDGGSYVGSLRLTQLLSENSYVNVQAYRTYNRNRFGYVDDDGNGFTDVGEDGDFLDFTDPSVVERYIGVNPAEDRKMFVDVVTDNFSETQINTPAGDRYRLARPAPFSEDTQQATTGFKIDYANQITFNHFIQAGVEYKLRSIDYQAINSLPGDGAILNDNIEPFRFNEYERSPSELGIYASDRIEYGGLIVNLGLRVNIADRDLEQISDFFFPFVRDTISVAGQELARNTIVRGDDVPVDVLWNPTIGVSHPIGTNASMYFSFSRSSQLQPYSTLYENYDGIHTTSRFFNIPDPESDPITSVNYELGAQWEFAEGWGADLNAYTRSIDNYGRVGYTAFSRPGVPRFAGFDRFSYVTSFGYADARGIELVLRRAPVQLTDNVRIGLNASYTFSTVESARVTGENLRTFRVTADEVEVTELPFDDAGDFQNFPQNVVGGSTLTGGYDRRHRVILRGFGVLPFDVNVGLLGTVESGFQYPKAIGADPRDRELLTAPTNVQLDFRLEKGFSFTPQIGLDVYLDVINLFNRDNVVGYDTDAASGAAIFQETGIPGTRLTLRDGTSIYGPARTVFFGSRLRF